MNIYIPEIGTKLRLTEGWIFQLYNEYRNNAIFQALGTNIENLKKITYSQPTKWGGTATSTYHEMFLPIDTLLTVRRVYIRVGAADFSSVTFLINDTTHPFLIYNRKKKSSCGAFWAKLTDVNNIKCEIVTDTVKTFGKTIGKNENENF